MNLEAAFEAGETIQSTLAAALSSAWKMRLDPSAVIDAAPDDVVTAANAIVRSDSAPARQMLMAICAGLIVDPSSSAKSIQQGSGVDRRGQADKLVPAYSGFLEEHGLRLKVSKDPGVSNPWRTPSINDVWLAKRRGTYWQGFVDLTDWLEDVPPDESVRDRAELLLAVVCSLTVEHALAQSFEYPKFEVSPALAGELVELFLQRVSDRPDAMEAVVTAAARVIATQLGDVSSVDREDTNSPDPIDILIRDGHGVPASAIEVTDEAITVSKLKHEVVPAMQFHGISRATVVARPPSASEAPEVDRFINRIRVRFGQTIDVVELSTLQVWLSLPGLAPNTATRFVRHVGEELDALSNAATRRAWLETLNDYVTESLSTLDVPESD